MGEKDSICILASFAIIYILINLSNSQCLSKRIESNLIMTSINKVRIDAYTCTGVYTRVQAYTRVYSRIYIHLTHTQLTKAHQKWVETLSSVFFF